LEDISSIQPLIIGSNSISEEKKFISLSPGASYAFEKFNIQYKSIRDYGGGEERYQQCLENFQRIDRMVTILDKKLAHLHDIPTLTPARYSIYYLKILFDGLWNIIHILKTIIDAEHPDSIRLYTSYPIISASERYASSNDELVYSEVLNMSGWQVPIEIIHKKSPYTLEHQTSAKKNGTIIQLFTHLKNQNFLFDLGLIGKRKGIGAAGAALYYYITCWHRKPVLIYNSGYNWDDSLVELYKSRMVPVYRFWDKTLDKALSENNNYREEVRRVCKVHPAMREFDQILDIDVSAYFFDRASMIIGGSFGESIHSYHMIREMIQQKKIRCLLLSVHERAPGHAVVQAARDAGIPIVSWQHGGAGYCYHPMMPFIEFVNSDWHFVYGVGVSESYRTTAGRLLMEKIPVFVPIGSSSLDSFYMNAKRSLSKQANKPVVYISGPYQRNIYNVSQPYDPSDWDEHLWDVQKQIINLAKKNHDKEFIIKLHPVHKDKEPLISYISDHKIKNVKIIVSEMTVRELTDIADVVIFDSISTGILQVLTSVLPVFVYTGLHGIRPDTITQLKKRAYVYDNIGDFTANIDEYIKTKQVIHSSVDCLNRDFLLKYGTDIQTHNSAGRAIEKLKEILSGRELQNISGKPPKSDE
jgi:hypothetical protein